MWEDGTNLEIVYRHYGYDPEIRHHCIRGAWPREKLTERLSKLGELATLAGLCEKKFRIVIDGDPEFPRILIQIFREPE